MRNKRIIPGELHHVYQRSYDRGLLFYSSADVLTYFTICMTMAKRYEIRVIGVCPMRDHVHQLVIPPSVSAMTKFEMGTNRLYAREFNLDISRQGQIFEHSYDFAVKRDGKRARSSIIYLYDNPVEKQLCKKAVEAKWNFLAYGFSSHPFSEPCKIEETSRKLRRSMEEVESSHEQGRYLNQRQIRRLFENLDPDQKNILTDFIVETYSIIDYERLFSYWKSSQEMLVAMDSTTGAEYGINEGTDRFSDDRIYYKIGAFVAKTWKLTQLKDVLKMSEVERFRMVGPIQRATGAETYHIYKFLHLSHK